MINLFPSFLNQLPLNWQRHFCEEPNTLFYVFFPIIYDLKAHVSGLNLFHEMFGEKDENYISQLLKPDGSGISSLELNQI